MCKKEISTTMNKPLVLVTWLDAKDGQTGWHSIEDIQKERLAMCHSTGWLMFKDETKIIIMADYSEFDGDKEGGRHITIPTGWVQTITYLKADQKEKQNEHGKNIGRIQKKQKTQKQNNTETPSEENTGSKFECNLQ